MTAKLTTEQRAALDALGSPKRRAFVLAYVGEAMGNATEAARIAGYKNATSQASRLLTFVNVKAAVQVLQTGDDDARFASAAERKAFYARVMRGEVARGEPKPDWKARLKAAELLGKVEGDFTERREVTHHGAAQVAVILPPDRQVVWASGAPLGADVVDATSKKKGKR